MKTTRLPEPTEAEIQKAAYHLWLEGGCQPGVELDNWLAAKELLKHHHGRDGGRSKKRPLAQVTSTANR